MDYKKLRSLKGKQVLVYLRNSDPFPGELVDYGAGYNEDDEMFEQVTVDYQGTLFEFPADIITSVELAADK